MNFMNFILFILDLHSLSPTTKDDSQMQMSIRRVDLELKCDRVYVPELMMHNITLTWDLSNQHPLAREALLAHEFRVYALNSFFTTGIVEAKFYVQSQVCFKLL